MHIGTLLRDGGNRRSPYSMWIDGIMNDETDAVTTDISMSDQFGNVAFAYRTRIRPTRVPSRRVLQSVSMFNEAFYERQPFLERSRHLSCAARGLEGSDMRWDAVVGGSAYETAPTPPEAEAQHASYSILHQQLDDRRRPRSGARALPKCVARILHTSH